MALETARLVGLIALSNLAAIYIHASAEHLVVPVTSIMKMSAPPLPANYM